MTNYANGAVLERATAEQLRANGYYPVRSGGSRGVADVIGLKRGEVLLVQCKRDGYLTQGERAALLDLATGLGAVPLAASWGKQGNAARFVLFRKLFCDPFGLITFEPWSPDWAMEGGRGGG